MRGLQSINDDIEDHDDAPNERTTLIHHSTRMNKREALVHVLKTVGSFTITNGVSAAYTLGNGIVLAKLGGNAVAAGPLMATLACAVFSLSRGGVSPLSNIVGEMVGELKVTPGNEAAIGAHSRRSWVIALGLSGISYAVFLNAERILRSSGVDDEVARAAQDYFSGISYGLVPSLLNLCDQQLVLGLNHQKVTFLSGIAYPVIAAAVGYPLALGLFNLPQYGIAAIGWGGSVSGVLSFIALRLYLTRAGYQKYCLYAWEGLTNLKEYRDFLSIAIPYAGLNIAEWGNLLGVSLLVGPNSTILAATQATINPVSAFTALVMALTQATGVCVSTCLGEGKKFLEKGDRSNALVAFANAKTLGYAAIGVGMVTSGAATLVFTTIPREIAAVFLDSSQDDYEEILAMAVPFLIAAGAGLLPDTVRNVAGGALRGYGDVKYMPIVSILMMSLVGLCIGGVLTREFDEDTNWLFITRCMGIVVAGLMVLLRFKNREPDVLNPGPQAVERLSYCQRLRFCLSFGRQDTRGLIDDDLEADSAMSRGSRGLT